MVTTVPTREADWAGLEACVRGAVRKVLRQGTVRRGSRNYDLMKEDDDRDRSGLRSFYALISTHGDGSRADGGAS